MILNSSFSTLSMGTGIGTIATDVAFVGIPVSTALGSLSLPGAISTGISSALIKRYQKRLFQNEKLNGMVTSAIVVFEATISEILQNGHTFIVEREFMMIQGVYFNTL